MTSVASVTEKRSSFARWTCNAFLWRYPLAALFFDLVAHVVDYLGSHYGDWTPLGIMFMLLEMLLAVSFLLLALVFLVTKRFRLAPAVALGAVILSLTFVSGGHVGEAAFSLIDRVRFYFTASQYAAVIDKMPPQQRSSTVVFFQWGETGFLRTSIFYWVVYDESGEIARPDEKRSAIWIERVHPHNRVVNSPDCITDAFRLNGHYYSARTTCQ